MCRSDADFCRCKVAEGGSSRSSLLSLSFTSTSTATASDLNRAPSPASSHTQPHHCQSCGRTLMHSDGAHHPAGISPCCSAHNHGSLVTCSNGSPNSELKACLDAPVGLADSRHDQSFGCHYPYRMCGVCVCGGLDSCVARLCTAGVAGVVHLRVSASKRCRSYCSATSGHQTNVADVK